MNSAVTAVCRTTSSPPPPGSVSLARHQEWLVTGLKRATDGWFVHLQGLSELVRNTEAAFSTAIDDVVESDPRRTQVVAADVAVLRGGLYDVTFGRSSSPSCRHPHRSACWSPVMSPPRASTCTASATTSLTSTTRGLMPAHNKAVPRWVSQAGEIDDRIRRGIVASELHGIGG